MKELRRLRCGQFDIKEAVTLGFIEKATLEEIEEKTIKIEDLFKENEQIVLNENLLRLFLEGVRLKKFRPDGVYKIYNEANEFIGTGILNDFLLKRDVIM